MECKIIISHNNGKLIINMSFKHLIFAILMYSDVNVEVKSFIEIRYIPSTKYYCIFISFSAILPSITMLLMAII